jgi:geranylgeranyl diphosphate synthase, type II
MGAINQEIEATKYGESPVELYQPIDYIMALGGKRMRPLLALLSYQIFANDWQKILKPAIAVEVFHNFTLMHDDIMDNAPIRRGKSTVHEKWNNNIAILSGDVMLVVAYELLSSVDDKYFKQVFKRFNKTAAEVCEGQQFDMNFENQNEVKESDYLEMIRLKTAVLLGFSMEMGGILAGASEKDTRLLYDAGVNIGIGFQLMDDILDVYGDPEKFGKQVGGDIIGNKKTFLLINALEKASGETAQKLQYWLTKKDFDKTEKVNAVTEIYNELNIKALSEQKMNHFFEIGLNSLESLNTSTENKQILIDFIKNLIEREA